MRSVVLGIVPVTHRVDVRSGDLVDIDPNAREAVLVGVLNALALERARTTRNLE